MKTYNKDKLVIIETGDYIDYIKSIDSQVDAKLIEKLVLNFFKETKLVRKINLYRKLKKYNKFIKRPKTYINKKFATYFPTIFIDDCFINITVYIKDLLNIIIPIIITYLILLFKKHNITLIKTDIECNNTEFIYEKSKYIQFLKECNINIMPWLISVLKQNLEQNYEIKDNDFLVDIDNKIIKQKINVFYENDYENTVDEYYDI